MKINFKILKNYFNFSCKIKKYFKKTEKEADNSEQNATASAADVQQYGKSREKSR